MVGIHVLVLTIMIKSVDKPSGLDDDCNESTEQLAVMTAALALDACITVSHVLLPVRWCNLLGVDILFGMSFAYAAPHVGKAAVPIFLALMVGASAGDRMSVKAQRTLFAKVLDEKRQRVQAEFRADVMTPPRLIGCASASEASTTETGAVFTSMETKTPSLKALINMGLKEHWLVNDQDVRVYHDKVLGQGGFGITYEGSMNHSAVAVKKYFKSICGEPDSTVINELRILRHVCHPNIVLFHGALISLERGDISIVMEKVDGMSFSKYLQRMRTWTSQESVYALQNRMMRFMAEALIHLHACTPCIVHCDLKPDNIIVEERKAGPFPKLLDFGLARVVSRKERLRGGTPYWMAPEVRKGLVQPRPPIDVYAFGLLLYYVVVGEIRGNVGATLEKQPNLYLEPNPSPLFLLWILTIRECANNDADKRPTMLQVYERLFLDRTLDEQAALTGISL